MTETLTPNAPLIQSVMDHIVRHRDMWNQDSWAEVADEVSLETIEANEYKCGATFCFAGWTMILAGHKVAPADDIINPVRVDGRDMPEGEFVAMAAEHLGLTRTDAERIFEYFTDDVEALADRVQDITGVPVEV